MKQNKTIRPGKCTTYRCTNTPTGSRTHCETCRKRIWREHNLAKDAYQNLKSSAGRRGIPFDLSLEDFIEFATPCNYLIAKGRSKEGLTVGRINENPALGYYGYRKDNIMPQKLGENAAYFHEGRREARKNKVLQYDYFSKSAKYVDPRPAIAEQITEDLPF